MDTLVFVNLLRTKSVVWTLLAVTTKGIRQVSIFLGLVYIICHPTIALSMAATRDVCSRYADCWSCTQHDFTKDIQAEKTYGCVWCDVFPKTSGSCMSRLRKHECISAPTQLSDQCNEIRSPTLKGAIRLISIPLCNSFV